MLTVELWWKLFLETVFFGAKLWVFDFSKISKQTNKIRNQCIIALNSYQDNEHIKFTREDRFLTASKNFDFLFYKG